MRANRVLRFIRALLGLGYLAGAAFHLANVTLGDPAATFTAFAGTAWWEWYARLIRDVAVTNATPVTVAVLLFEFAVGVLILSRDGTARYGHLAAIVFNLALIPTMSAPYWYGNVVLIVLHLSCLVTRFQEPPARTSTMERLDRSRELTRV